MTLKLNFGAIAKLGSAGFSLAITVSLAQRLGIHVVLVNLTATN